MSIITSKEALLNLSVNKQKEIIRKDLTKEEMDEMKTTIANDLMEVNRLEEELAEVKAVYKQKMAPLKKEIAGLLSHVKAKFIDETLEVYLVPDYDNRIMEFYNDEGTKVGERRMMISELQGKLNLK